MQIRRKPRPDEKAARSAHSLYSIELGAPDPARYRSTPCGAPDVQGLVRPGMSVRTSYGTGGTVVAVNGPYLHIAADGREFPHFTIVYVPANRFGRHTERDLCWINECVAVDGRILKLLEANTEEMFLDRLLPGRA